MANNEHLAILKQGVEVWNKWRDENPDVRPNLSGTDLSGANLFRADLFMANLSGADLFMANLSGADLFMADLSGADLRGADLFMPELETYLRAADLYGANLSGANLSGANLSEANLSEANLSEANLSEADLERSQVIGTNFYNATLTGACIKDWQINSKTNLEEVICEYVYLDSEYLDFGNVDKTERRPINGNFAPGEFASLYKKIIETTDLIISKTLENDNTVNKPEKNIDVDNTSNNQGVQFYANSTIHTWENLRFRSKTEIKIAEALDRTGVLFVPNSLARLTTPKGRENKEADFLICYNGKWGVLEVDGPYHTAERRVEEQERERIFKKNGIKVVERFDAQRCYNHPDEVVQEFFNMIEIGYY
ncbi:pentapeptide repeat-containing protein [Anabaena sp. FACHB-1391]|uniref:pentapeptide repeat-containing protein n=1 Tax=Anabaena sp. FACHB-1391 TaxID=2692771 RepID=UPI001F54A949|nr:pentapeptide repeat-containing protein [Anabaena sp. FACHB-1391]